MGHRPCGLGWLGLLSLIAFSSLIQGDIDCLQSIECQLRRPSCISECRDADPEIAPKYNSCMSKCLDSNDSDSSKDNPAEDNDELIGSDGKKHTVPEIGMDTLLKAYNERVDVDQLPPIPREATKVDKKVKKDKTDRTDKCVRKCIDNLIFLVEATDPDYDGETSKEEGSMQVVEELRSTMSTMAPPTDTIDSAATRCLPFLSLPAVAVVLARWWL